MDEAVLKQFEEGRTRWLEDLHRRHRMHGNPLYAWQAVAVQLTTLADLKNPLTARRFEAEKPAHPPLPVRVDRRTAANLVTQRYFPISYRTVEAWPLTVRRVNGKATVETAELFAFAQSKLDAAPPIKGGRRRVAAA
jgi:hypothetical protein